MWHDESVSRFDAANFLSRYDGGSVEENQCRLNFPRVGRKSEIKAGGFDFKSLLRIEKHTGRSNINDAANFMSKSTGKDFENCFTELIKPYVNRYAGHSSGGSGGTFTPGEMLDMRGF